MAKPITIDGSMRDPGWADPPWTDDFIDITGEEALRPQFRTRVKMGWDDQFFYVAAELEEPHVWGTITEKNAVIFEDNDFEVFIDPDCDGLDYYEFEINALGTIWELRLPKPYGEGGVPVLGCNLPGLKSAVCVRGTLNDPVTLVPPGSSHKLLGDVNPKINHHPLVPHRGFLRRRTGPVCASALAIALAASPALAAPTIKTVKPDGTPNKAAWMAQGTYGMMVHYLIKPQGDTPGGKNGGPQPHRRQFRPRPFHAASSMKPGPTGSSSRWPRARAIFPAGTSSSTISNRAITPDRDLLSGNRHANSTSGAKG